MSSLEHPQRVARRTGLAATAAVAAAAAAFATATPSPAAHAGGGIVFASPRDGDSELYVASRDGTHERRLTTNRSNEYHPAASPDGRHIAFAGDRDGDEELFVMRADGTRVRQLTHNASRTPGVPADDGGASWSPDGRRIVFHSRRSGQYDLYVINADGTGERRLTRTPADEVLPDWSPDGDAIAFSANRDDPEDMEIYVMAADGSDVTRLTRTDRDVVFPDDDTAPAWSPDGTRIAWANNGAGDLDLLVMDRDGTNRQRVARTRFIDDSFPAWSRNGRWLLSVRDEYGRPTTIARIRPDGTGAKVLARGTGADWLR